MMTNIAPGKGGIERDPSTLGTTVSSLPAAGDAPPLPPLSARYGAGRTQCERR